MSLKILVIDDDAVMRLTIQGTLKKHGYETLMAENGEEGLKLYKAEKPDIVITDMLMPNKEGLETISEIRAINPQAKIVAMSGGGSMHNMSFLQLAKKLGANHLLTKPVKPEQLLVAVESLIEL